MFIQFLDIPSFLRVLFLFLLPFLYHPFLRSAYLSFKFDLFVGYTQSSDKCKFREFNALSDPIGGDSREFEKRKVFGLNNN